VSRAAAGAVARVADAASVRGLFRRCCGSLPANGGRTN